MYEYCKESGTQKMKPDKIFVLHTTICFFEVDQTLMKNSTISHTFQLNFLISHVFSVNKLLKLKYNNTYTEKKTMRYNVWCEVELKLFISIRAI